MSEDVFPFTPEFQLSILQLMLKDTAFTARCVDLIEPSYFDNSVFQWYFKIIRDHYIDHRALMNDVALKNEFRAAITKQAIRKNQAGPYVATFKKLWDFSGSPSYIQSKVIQFAKHQAFKRATLKTPEYLDGENYDEIMKQFQKASTIGKLSNTKGLEYFKTIDKRMDRFSEEEVTGMAIPTGIPRLDRALKDGGLGPKELGVVMAPPGRGKSNFLVAMGKRAILANKKVIHYTLEMSDQKVSERYDAAFSGISTKIIRQCIDNIQPLYNDPQFNPRFQHKIKPLRQKLYQYKEWYGNNLIIKEFPTRSASVNTIHAHLENLTGENFFPDMIIIDYCDIMKSTTHYNDRWQEQGAIYEEVRGLAGEKGIPIWTGCQANRASMSKQIITMENIADSFEKAKISDVILALCQTDEEKEDNKMRMFVAKNRDSLGGQTIDLKQNIGSMQFHCINQEDWDDSDNGGFEELEQEERSEPSSPPEDEFKEF